MKHFMLPKGGILKENHSEGSQSPNPKKPMVPSSASRKPKSSKENAPPSDLNSAHDPCPSTAGKSPPPSTGKIKCPLPPRPPSSNPNSLKRKLNNETVLLDSAISGASDSGVKVIVRVRPPNKDEEESETIVQKVSDDSLSILGQPFTFDSVADLEATQLDIYQHVGAPLVEHCLAGFNSSVFAYGQTGSGKTYTMWGPTNALSDQQGLTPRVLEQLFARIKEEQIKHAKNELKYQCRCSFLEIYNEQITDLLDPNQRNLQIREDVKSGVYVENLTEECVYTMKDVSQLLAKGLSNRRTGATSINAESSRSHSVFTCVVESRCKSIADGISSFRTSRINLVDLAGSERQKLTGAGGERLKEAGNINRSLSQLGNLINILAEVSQTGKQRHIPYRDSRLTFLLQESLGGNAKLAMVCAISPAQSCKSETFSTLRFAQRAKAIKNKAVVNEVMQDDVNFLREVIRQLKDELQRTKANGNTADANTGCSAGWNARRSLHLLKFSLSRPTTLAHGDNDTDAEMEIDEEAVERLCAQVGLQSTYSKENNTTCVRKQETVQSNLEHMNFNEGIHKEPQQGRFEGTIVEEDFKDTDINMEEGSPEQAEKHENVAVDCAESVNDRWLLPESDGVSADVLLPDASNCNPMADTVAANLSKVPYEVSPVLMSPNPSFSSRVDKSIRKSLRTSSMLSASQKDLKNDGRLVPEEALGVSFALSVKSSSSKTQSMQRSKNFLASTENLAASLHRGLEVLETHRNSLALRRSSFRFPLKSADFRPVLPIERVEVGVQTVPQETESLHEDGVGFLCSRCRIPELQPEESNDTSNMQLVPVGGSDCSGKSMKQVPKAVEKVLAGAIRREMALEEICAKKTSEITHLNRLVQQCKHERECNAIIGQTREDKILRLESLMDGVLPTEDFMEEELSSLRKEHQLLKQKYENHPEVLRTKIELKRAQDELERYQNFVDLGEREVLLEEIQDLRNHLQYYIDSSSVSAQKRSLSLKLINSCEQSLVPTLSTISESTDEIPEENLEQERARWTEAESKWISLAEELRSELEANRSLAEKLKDELDSEKKCSEELKDAMQLAMAGHARMLEQYADLEEKHMQLLARHRKIQEGITDVKKSAAKAGVRGTESKFINALAVGISALKVEKEKERQYLRDENKGLRAQLRDTAEAVEAAGEVLVRLKEAEEAIAAAEERALEAEQETGKAYKQIDELKSKHEKEISMLNQFLAESRLPQEASRLQAKYDAGEPQSGDDQRWKEEFESFCKDENAELSKLGEPSLWFSGHDRCNI